MSHYYDKLVEALGGKHLTNPSNVINKAWSPNNYKRVILTTNGIYVERHLNNTSVPIIVRTDINRVADEISTNKFKDPLRALTDYKVFSCLEELVVNPQIIKPEMVNRFMQSVKATHRLRSVTYISGGLDAILEAVSIVRKDNSLFAEKVQPAQGYQHYIVDKEGDFYRRYYLRPSMYHLDREGGLLHSHFTKIENQYESLVSQKKKETDAVRRVQHDIRQLADWEIIVSFLNSHVPEAKPLAQVIGEVIRKTNLEISSLSGMLSDGSVSRLSPKLASIYKFFSYNEKVRGGSVYGSGFLPAIGVVASSAKQEIIKLGKTLSIPKGTIPSGVTDRELLLLFLPIVTGDGLKVSESALPENGNEAVSHLESVKDKVRADFLSDEEATKLLEVYHALKDEYRSIFGQALSAVKTGFSPRIKRKELDKLGLPKQSEVLDLLGYSSPEGSPLAQFEFPDFDARLSELCRLATVGREVFSQPWNGLSFVSKCDYVIKKFSERGI